MPLVGVDQDHQIVCESRIFDVGVLAVACDLPRSLQHPVHLIEVEVAEQRRDDPTLRNAHLAGSFQHNLQEMHDVRVINPPCHLLQQSVVTDAVEVGRRSKSRTRVFRWAIASATRLIAPCAVRLGRYPNDPGWKSASKTGSSTSLSAPCTTLSRIAGIERTRTLPPSFGISCFRAGSGR